MDGSYNGSSWNVIGASVQGPYHKNRDQPNQDAIGWSQKKPGELPLILSVADGLGDDMFFRSDKGSRFAIEASIEICNRHIRKLHRWRERQLRNRLLSEIIECWNHKIFEDLKCNPFSPEEEQVSTNYVEHLLSRTPENDGIDKSIFIQSYPYSTTLNTVIVTPSAIIVLQVGDGDIVIVRDDGSTKEIFSLEMDCGRVIPLSYPNVRDSCNVCRRGMDQAKPLIIYLSSDGYSAGYDTSKVGFDEIIAFEFHSKIQEFSIAAIHEALPSLLVELSQGSFDDLTLGIIMGPGEKIKNTQLQLKNLCDQSEEVKEPGGAGPVVESTLGAPDVNINEPEEKCQPFEDIAGTERIV